MPSPFPGMDPYLEISGDWRDFHSRFLNVCADALAEQLPENYIVRIEERFQVLEYPQETVENRYPDVSVARIRPSRSAAMPTIPIATLEPEVIPLVTTIVEDVKERWIEIRRRPDWEAVTIIELLSPANKRGYGYDDYLYKRVSLIARTIHLVELDFLIGGQSSSQWVDHCAATTTSWFRVPSSALCRTFTRGRSVRPYRSSRFP